LEEYVDTGRRKTAVASVRLRTSGSGKIDINGRTIDEYFAVSTVKDTALSPLNIINALGRYDLVIRVKGGGIEAQAVAIRHGLTRALVRENEELRPEFKGLGFLTRDPRMKERKKYGRAGARKRFQFSKR
jgi:small subunit ribosomal protein S9